MTRFGNTYRAAVYLPEELALTIENNRAQTKESLSGYIVGVLENALIPQEE
ncbi:hypothetical protein [Methanosarcina mazei]|jgi:hypothetical protein|uniref:hypothetical protein n=1 Tax=Methanosarcina mazei TaxID=2209 RepID=UPI000A5C578F|nr:hypothetical protein [Methanosarcina mazei]